MANLLRPSNRLRQITWRKDSSDSKMYFTLHTIDYSSNPRKGKITPIAKAVLTADQIEGYILKNSILKDAVQVNTKDKTKERLQNLFNEIDTLLNMSPCEDDCTDEENAMYSDMTNLKESLFDVIN